MSRWNVESNDDGVLMSEEKAGGVEKLQISSASFAACGCEAETLHMDDVGVPTLSFLHIQQMARGYTDRRGHDRYVLQMGDV